MANVVDAAIVGKVCDGAILLIESGFVGYRAAQKAIKQLEKSGTHMLGAVLKRLMQEKKNIIPITVMEVSMVMAMARIMKMRRKGM